LDEIRYEIEVAGDAPEEQLRALVERTAGIDRASPAKDALVCWCLSSLLISA
jgi:hypothetical protein